MIYEVIVRNEKDALKVELPKEVVDKLKEVSKYNEEDFKEKSNEFILKTLIKSLDVLLYSLEHTTEGITKTELEGESVKAEKNSKKENASTE